ncbi:hypothetical protein SCHPADRAFT_939403 [Schizopora paradoxa]|uniref:C2H2-type domain-containing protein n=1 Tax=Schizopora paradoxa TaxID=27342 RepID=A0A0H2RSM9_9AGAM|nr:hypothetical protein SCHPADRAFT_939403 [Schizopora paradoxa]
MSDGRYTSQNPHSQHVPFHRDDPAYGGRPPHPHSHSTRSPRSSLAYSNTTHPHPAQPGQVPSYPPHGYPTSTHPTTPPMQGYPPNRVRSTSMSLSHHPAHVQSHHHRAPSGQIPAQHSPLSSSHRPDLAHLAGFPPRSRTPGPPASSSHFSGHTSDGMVGASPQRPFQCDLCALSFSRQHDLKRHKETHNGERPYLCNGPCNKTFTRKDALKRHQLSKNCGTVDDH